MEAVDFKKSAQPDLLVVPQAELHHILDVRSLRAEALASHHFLVLARFARDLIARTFSTRTAKRTKDGTSLKEACPRQTWRHQHHQYIHYGGFRLCLTSFTRLAHDEHEALDHFQYYGSYCKLALATSIRMSCGCTSKCVNLLEWIRKNIGPPGYFR